MSRLLIFIGAGIAAIAPVAATEAFVQPTAAVAPLDSRAVVAAIRRTLADNYVLGEVRPKLDAALANGLATGRYDVTDPTLLAERINADLSAVAHDKHLGIDYAPEQSAALAARPPGAGADDAPPSAAEIVDARRRNHGIVAMKVLPGNIRYIETNGFVWVGPESAEAYDRAMAFLQDGDAAIIDLRRNGGGSPEAVQYMISHFLAPNRPLVTFYMGKDGVNRLSSLAKLPGGRMVGKPLYVLTSGNSASAAEEFAGHIGGFKIGELIGATTAGAGFRNEFFPLPGGFVISVSVGRAVLASTGHDWEGKGISPTTTVDPDKALEIAQAHAFKRLAQSASPGARRNLEIQAALLLAQVTPVQTALPPSGYAGVYGERTVSAAGNGITIQRTGGPVTELVAIGPNLFAYTNDPGGTLSFDVAGNQAIALHLVRSDGSTADATRQR